MKIIKTKFKNLYLIKPNVYRDKRGYFLETYNELIFKKKFKKINFIQSNESYSCKNVLRGLHFQKKPYEQTKLVRVVKGEILDVVVDLRK